MESCLFQISIGSSISIQKKLSRGFRYCCSFYISPLVYKSLNKLSTSVKVSVFPDNPNANKIFNLVQVSIMFERFMIFIPSPGNVSD